MDWSRPAREDEEGILYHRGAVLRRASFPPDPGVSR